MTLMRREGAGLLEVWRECWGGIQSAVSCCGACPGLEIWGEAMLCSLSLYLCFWFAANTAQQAGWSQTRAGVVCLWLCDVWFSNQGKVVQKLSLDFLSRGECTDHGGERKAFHCQLDIPTPCSYIPT